MMNKQAYEHMVGLVLNKEAYDMAKYKDVDDYVNNGRFGSSLGSVKSQQLRRQRYMAWQNKNQINQAAKQNGTYVKGNPMSGTFQQGKLTSVNGKPVTTPNTMPVAQPNRQNVQPANQAPAVQPRRNKVMLPETEWISPEASEF